MEPSKYRPVSLLNMGGKVLEKILINRINHHMYKNEQLTDRQYGFTPQKSTTDAAMEAKRFIEPELEKRKVVIMTSLDVKGTFDAGWWPGVLKGLKDAECHRNLYHLCQGYFSQRTTVMTTNNIRKEVLQKVAHKDHAEDLDSGTCFTTRFLNWNLQVIQK
jgi:hypothetical protein